MYSIEFFRQKNIFGDYDPVKFGSIYPVRKNSGLIFVRQGGEIKGYRKIGETWQEIWTEEVFRRDDTFSVRKYPWIVLEDIIKHAIIIVVKHPEGIRFYRTDEDGENLKLISTDGLFHDVYNLRINFGNFYPDDCLGLIAGDARGETDFYVATAQSLNTSTPLLQLDVELNLGKEWASNKVLIESIARDSNELILLQTPENVEFFGFDNNYKLLKMLSTREIAGDNIFFADLTHSKYKDALILNSTGLFLFSYDKQKNDYNFRSRDEHFSAENGWTESYTETVAFFDINNDHIDDLVYTGKNGLTAKSFDTRQNKWKVILSPEFLENEHRYWKVIASVKPGEVFLQNYSGEIRWGRVETIDVPTDIPTTQSPTEAPTPVTKFCTEEIEVRHKTVDKPVMRWIEQFEHDFIRDSLNNLGGQVNFGIPLIDTEVINGWGINMDLSYREDPKGSLLGEKWFLPLAQDYITLNKKSIFPEDWEYFLVLQGQTLRLEEISNANGSQLFKISGKTFQKYDMRIELSSSKWTIQDSEEVAVYGENSQQISLSWRNWVFPGTDLSGLQPEVISWFLSSRRDKNSGQMLTYTYQTEDTQFGDKTYTSSVRLVSIADGKDTKLEFEYSPKDKSEFSVPNPVSSSKEILFPVPLTESHFVSGYRISTPNYSQRIQFTYITNGTKRFLNSLEQGEEELIKFTYERDQLKTIQVPILGTTVRFDYERQNSPNYTITYPVSETPKFASGNNYTVMAYKKMEQIAVKFMSSDFTQIIKDCLSDLDFECPKISGDYKQMKIIPYEDSFLIHLQDGSNQTLHWYERKNGRWSQNPQTATFTDEAKIYFGSKVFAVLENSRMTMFGYKNGWTTKIWPVGEIISLWVQRNFAAAYASDSVKLFYFESGNWGERVLADLRGYSPKDFVQKFDIVEEVSKNITGVLESYAFQVSNNIVLHNSIKEDQGLLYSSLRLYTLGPRLEVSNQQTVEIKKENIYELKFDKNNEKNTITTEIGYVKEGEIFKLRAKSVWGSDIDKIDQEHREEAKTKFLKDLNNDKDFQENARKGFMVGLSKYLNKLQGVKVYSGNDTQVTFSGMQWVTGNHSEDKSVPLGKKFKLERLDEKTYILYENNSRVKQFMLHSKDSILNSYPSFIATQKTENTVEVLGFSDLDKIGTTTIFEGEKLIFNNGQNLMTTANVTGSEEKMELRIRPGSNFAIRDLFVVKQNELSDGTSRRLTEFRSKLEISQKPFTISQTMTQIPGGGDGRFGFHEVAYTSVNGNKTKSEKWFDSRGREVVPPTKERRTDEQESERDVSPSHLLDRTGRWLISDFTPYRLQDEMAAYFGFEDYESGRINSENAWIIENAQVVKGLYSLSGENYLLLDRSSKLEATLSPKDQSITYLASSWLNPGKLLELNKTTPHLKATLLVENEDFLTLHSQVKDQTDGWVYLELILDFTELKSLYNKYKGLPKNPKFRIRISAEAQENEKLHVDHIRFIPLTRDYEINIFHSLTGKKIALLQSDGQFKKYMRNRLMENVAVIKEKGVVAEFITKSGTGKLIGREASKPSVVKFEPEDGFLESFDPRSFCNRWQLEPDAWVLSPSRLKHENNGKHSVFPAYGILDDNFNALRFYFNLQDDQASLKLAWNGGFELVLVRKGGNALLLTQQDASIDKLPTSGELIVALDEKHFWIWFDGVLISDRSVQVISWKNFYFQAKGKLFLEDLIVMNRPALGVQYYNSFGEKIQEFQLENSNSALIKETLYDQLGRPAIKTKATKLQSTYNLLSYRMNFTTNKYLQDENSVWETGILKGEIDELNPEDEGISYSRTMFENNPLNYKSAIGMPGKDFSVTGDFSIKFSRETDVSLIKNLFPTHLGYRHEVQKLPNKSVKILVFDGKSKQIANYIRVPGYDHSLSTYEYDKNGFLAKVLPPVYHERANTTRKTEPWRSGIDHLTPEELKLQLSLGTHTTFDENGNLLKKVSPDAKNAHYVYDAENNLKLMIYEAGNTNHTVYMDYDARGQLWRTGHFEREGSKDYQLFYYSYDERNPAMRGKMKQCVTQSNGETIVDKLYYGSDDKLLTKETVASFHKDDDMSQLKKVTKANRVHTIAYPLKLNGQQLKVLHTYNRLGQLVGLGTFEEPYRFAKFSYHPTGQPTRVDYLPNSSQTFVREYHYNSPGFLVKISDPYLSADLTYTGAGYGQNGFGDGSIMHLAQNATWPEIADPRWFQTDVKDLPIEFPEICYKALNRLGYISTTGQTLKLFLPELETRMPLVCGGHSGVRIAKTLARKHKPNLYGHLYSYGNHQELTKAKYYTQELKAKIKPLQRDCSGNINARKMPPARSLRQPAEPAPGSAKR